jgi:ribosomal protein S18 acetylase RimI-like enzyme
MAIRQALDTDQLNLEEIIDLSFPRFFRFFAKNNVNSDEGTVLIIETQGTISAFADIIEFNIGGQKYGCVLWIAVHPRFRRRGIAFTLTSAGVDLLKSKGVQAVFASTQWRNRGALATLSGVGFVRVGFLGLWRLFGWRVFGF